MNNRRSHVNLKKTDLKGMRNTIRREKERKIEIVKVKMSKSRSLMSIEGIRMMNQ